MRPVYAMNLDDLLGQTCPWLLGEGEENDVVISCRIRLSRNFVGFPFPPRATERDRYAIQMAVLQAAKEIFPENDYYFADMQMLSPLDREFLLERQLVSRELVLSEQPHAAVIDRQERFCIVVNEGDHLHIHATQSGLVPRRVWEQIDNIDNQLSEKLDYVFHEKYGFLTSSVTSAGTGMRVSAMMHLPGLTITGEMDKAARSLQKKNLMVSNIHGEGSRTLGDFFQISNRITLGKSEEELTAKLIDLIPQIADYERQARHFLVNNRREIIADRCSRAVGVLRTAQTISAVETMLHLSNLRLGIHTGLLKGFDVGKINSLMLHMQPAHIQKIHGTPLSPAEQDVIRAAYIRQRMAV